MLWILGGVGQGGFKSLGCLKDAARTSRRPCWLLQAPQQVPSFSQSSRVTSAAHSLMPAD